MEAADDSKEEIAESTEPPEASVVQPPDVLSTQEAPPDPESIAQLSPSAPSAPPPKRRFLKFALAGLLVAGLGLGTWLLVGGSSHSASALIEELPANSRVALAVDASVVTNDSEFQKFFEDLTVAGDKLRLAGPMEIMLVKTVPKIESIACVATQERLIACHLRGDFDDARSAFLSINEKMSETSFLGYQTWFRPRRKWERRVRRNHLNHPPLPATMILSS